jgi:hypothetical protein
MPLLTDHCWHNWEKLPLLIYESVECRDFNGTNQACWLSHGIISREVAGYMSSEVLICRSSRMLGWWVLARGTWTCSQRLDMYSFVLGVNKFLFSTRPPAFSPWFVSLPAGSEVAIATSRLQPAVWWYVGKSLVDELMSLASTGYMVIFFAACPRVVTRVVLNLGFACVGSCETCMRCVGSAARVGRQGADVPVCPRHQK